MINFLKNIQNFAFKARFVFFLATILVSTLSNVSAQCTDTPMLTSNGNSVGASGTAGLCFLCSVNSVGNLVNPSLTDHATVSIPVGVGGSGYIRLNLGQTYPAGTRVGWVADVNGGIAGLFNGVTLRAYNGDTLVGTVSGGALFNILGIGGGTNINGVFCEAFDRIEISMGSLVGLLATYKVYYAYVTEDCNFPVQCGATPTQEICGDMIDNDGDGKVDSEDTCVTICVAGESAPIIIKN